MTKYCKEHIPEGAEWEDTTWGKCSVCGVKGGVIVQEVPPEVKSEASVKALAEVVIKPNLEAPLAEQIEAIREAASKAETVVIDAVLVDKREPEETPVEAKSEAIDDVQVQETTEETTSEETETETEPESKRPEEPEHDKVPDTIQPTEQPLEAKREILEEAKRRIRVQTKKAEKAQKAEIARLKAQLAKLEPKEE